MFLVSGELGLVHLLELLVASQCVKLERFRIQFDLVSWRAVIQRFAGQLLLLLLLLVQFFSQLGPCFEMVKFDINGATIPSTPPFLEVLVQDAVEQERVWFPI